MEFTNYICTTCGLSTKNNPDEDGMVECEPCYMGMTKEEIEELKKVKSTEK
jgi:DNA-directed RNA polymerase subunit RPC12/RpoP